MLLQLFRWLAQNPDGEYSRRWMWGCTVFAALILATIVAKWIVWLG